ncbi:MAG: Crp/Fnr family transcriptional regulator [Clostridia bacterium]|nr:Crp/Fnr family transcriptional regulator [Clostridia bacterium]
MAEDIVSAAFARSALLAECDPDELRPWVRRHPAGAVLHDTLDGAPCVGLVVSGLIDVWSVAPDGNGVLLSALRPGDCFGICNLLRGGQLETTLRCAAGSTVAYIPKERLEGAFEKDSRLALRYAALCNEKLQFLLRRIAMLTAQTARGRLVSWLLLHTEPDGRVVTDMTRTDLAAALSVSRAALYRELHALTEAGALSMEGEDMVVPDRRKLEEQLRV